MKKIVLTILDLLLACVVSMIVTTPLMARTPFERMDIDDDGQLSVSGFRGPPAAFGRMDRNNDGYLTRQEAAGTRLLGERDTAGRVEKKLAAAGETKELTYVDTHNHILGRRGRGEKGEYDYEASARNVLAAMDTAGVKVNLLMPMPQAMNQKRRLYAEDLLLVVEDYPDRFAVLGGGKFSFSFQS